MIMSENWQRAHLERTRKDMTAPTLSVGDTVFCGGVYATVTDIENYAPGEHDHSPIKNEMNAVQVVTDNGSRWHGRESEHARRAASGYTNCACRDCFDTTVSSDASSPELCSECADAGCEPFPAEGSAIGRTYEHDCQRESAYVSDELGDAGTGHGAYEWRSGA